jgi:hypothetical protein
VNWLAEVQTLDETFCRDGSDPTNSNSFKK